MEKVKRGIKYCPVHDDAPHEFRGPHLGESICLDCKKHKPSTRIKRSGGSARVYDGKFYVTMNKQITAGIEHAFKNRMLNYLLHNSAAYGFEDLTGLDNYELAPRVANGSKSVLDMLRKHENRNRKNRKRGTSDRISGKTT
jgi:hypothetical protein